MQAETNHLPVSEGDLIDAIDGLIRTFLVGRPLPASLIDAIEYAMFGGGKRVRPVLYLRACEAVGFERIWPKE